MNELTATYQQNTTVLPEALTAVETGSQKSPGKINGCFFQGLDYYPFGSLMPGRNLNASDYRFGFNSMEKDDEFTGVTGSHLNFGARIYDSRIGRWLSIDPLYKQYPSLSTYQFASNNPIFLVDLDGNVIRIHYVDDKGNNKFCDYKPGKDVKINNEYVKNSVAALNHLRIHDEGFGNSAKTIVDQLAYSTTTVVDLKNTNGTPTIETGSNKQADVKWNPNIGVYLVDNANIPTGGKQSPLTLLIHELDHAIDAFLNINKFTTDATTPTGDAYEFLSEKKTIQGIETSVANFFCEGTRTNHYAGETFFTKDPTSTEEVLLDKSLESEETIEVENKNNYSWEF
jgi:RHS repeat-associated protein